jgi:hypothetical protein
MDLSLSRPVIASASSHFDLETRTGEENDFARFREALIDRISFLLDHDFERLLGLLYRVDVSEEKAKRMLAENPERPVAEVFADLVIERETEKVKSRLNRADFTQWQF